MRKKNAFRKLAAILSVFGLTLFFTTCDNPAGSGRGAFCPEEHFEVRVIADGTAIEIIGHIQVGGRTDVRIPPRIQGLPVTHIGDSVFNTAIAIIPSQPITRRYALTSVTIPNTVTHIGMAAFQDNQLANLTIPNSVISIGSVAFARNELTSVTIPGSVSYIEAGAFVQNHLNTVTIQAGVRHIGYVAFAFNRLTNVTIPNGVINIRYSAFRDNQLTTVTIPNSVIYIGEYAFRKNQISNVSVPSNATIIEGAFDPGVTITKN